MSDHAVELICKTVTDILCGAALCAFFGFMALLMCGAFDRSK